MNTLPITRFPQPTNFASLKDLPFTPITHDWFGISAKSPLSFLFACDPTALFFLARGESTPLLHPQAKAGHFFEGLWEYDVAEIFLRDDTNPTQYQEFNLDAQGAWWTQSFSAVRVRSQEKLSAAPGYETFSEHSKEHWISGLKIPRTALRINFSAQTSSRANVCFIHGSPQQFFSVAKLSTPQPDFHLPQEFIPLSV